ncbi:MAG: pyrroline-5-carboxylate reductase, partial [Verrucomicrobiota bacterium]|nr:pyrroline-5-carboxylate reductase [Verrucomicrobiota bacterium]
MTQAKIGFIGCGRMAQALILGLLEKKVFAPSEIGATDVSMDTLEPFARQTGITVHADNQSLIKRHDHLLLAIKPQNYASFAGENKKFFSDGKLLVSIVTGISLSRLSELSPHSVRVMPNTPALVGAGAAGFCVTASVSPEQIAFTQQIFQSVGIAEQVEESMMDAVTGLSGSGPAYIYLII